MTNIDAVLLVVALILLVLAALNVTADRVNLGWLGMAFFVATFFPF